jgi:hypothetical protein
MNPTTERQIDPKFNDLGPSDFDLDRIFLDDGTNAPQPKLEAAGGPSKLPDQVTRPVDPIDDPNGEMPDFDPSLLPITNGEIGLWSGEEGSDNPFFHPDRGLLPAKEDENLSDLPNGGPDGISGPGKRGIPEYTREDWIRDSERSKAEAEKHRNDNKPKPFDEESYKDNYKKSVERAKHDINQSDYWTVFDALLDAIFGTGPIFRTDPDQTSADGFDPHAMIDGLLGKGSTGLPENLGFDNELIGRMLGGYSGGVDKFGDFLKGLNAVDAKNGGIDALGAFIDQFGIDGLNAVLSQFLPFIDLEKHAFLAMENAEPTQPKVDSQLLLLVGDKPLDYLHIM